MPSLNQVKGRVNTWLEDTVWPVIVTRQEIYKDGVIDHYEDDGEGGQYPVYSSQPHGTYWQGLKTHAIEPDHVTADYADTVPDLLDGQPSDQPVSWTGFIPEINLAMPCAFVIDVYDGPDGQGFVASVYARYNGTLYSRSQNSGPETWRTVDWRLVDEEVII